MKRQSPFSYPEPFLRAVRRGALAKSISELASDWLVLTQDIVFLPCFYSIRLWIWPEPLVTPRVRRALGTRMGRALFLREGKSGSALREASSEKLRVYYHIRGKNYNISKPFKEYGINIKLSLEKSGNFKAAL